MSKILYCVAPHSSLFVKRPCAELQFGSGVVRSLLNKSGLEVDCIDFDALLNTHRSRENPFTEDDCLILANPYLTSLYASKPWGDLRYQSKIKDIISFLMDSLPDSHYSAVLFSIPRDEKNIMHVTRIINFSLLLARRLKTQTGAKMIWGGQALLYFKNKNDIKELFRYATCEDVDYVFFKNADKSLLDAVHSRRRLARPKLIFDRIHPLWDACVDFASRYRFTRFLAQRYRALKKSRKHPLHEKYLSRLRVEPDFQGFDLAAYQVNVRKAFNLPEGLPGQILRASQQDFVMYPLKFMWGCTHRCAFCPEGAAGLSILPVKEAVDLIERVLERYPQVRYFRFLNPQINASNRYAISFADELIRRKIKIFFSDSACLRNPQDEVFRALREAGCVKLWMGAESLSAKILKLINKNASPDDICRGIELLHKNDIWIGANLITAFPFEDQQDHECNIRFLKKHTDIINIWSLNVFELYSNVLFYAYADQYGINIGKDYFPGGQQFMFKEKGRGDFSQRQTTARQRIAELKALVPEYNDIAGNDYLVFYCYANKLNKNQTMSFIKKYFDYLQSQAPLPTDPFTYSSAQKWAN